MQPFFTIVERAGISQRHLADLIGVHKSTFTRVKTGERRLTADFAQRATDALAATGIRREDGLPYEAGDLFFGVVVTHETIPPTSITEAAD